jgi:predicted transcriptional regulator
MAGAPPIKEDEIRQTILNYLYQIHKKARSRKSIRVPISKIKKELKQMGLKEHEIVSNLDYLIQGQWVNVDVEESEFITPQGFTKKQRKEYYKISDTGINLFEGVSQFQRVDKSISGINVNNIQGVTIIGSQNEVVNINYTDLFRRLSLLSEAVRNTSQLSDEDKLNYNQDIITIRDQLSKPTPDKSIIRSAWENLKPLATITGVVSFFQKVGEIISGILG